MKPKAGRVSPGIKHTNKEKMRVFLSIGTTCTKGWRQDEGAGCMQGRKLEGWYSGSMEGGQEELWEG